MIRTVVHVPGLISQLPVFRRVDDLRGLVFVAERLGVAHLKNRGQLSCGNSGV